MELNKIYQGDCLELMKNLSDNSIDMILCDLPFGITDADCDKKIDLKKILGTSAKNFKTKLQRSYVCEFKIFFRAYQFQF